MGDEEESQTATDKHASDILKKIKENALKRKLEKSKSPKTNKSLGEDAALIDGGNDVTTVKKKRKNIALRDDDDDKLLKTKKRKKKKVQQEVSDEEKEEPFEEHPPLSMKDGLADEEDDSGCEEDGEEGMEDTEAEGEVAMETESPGGPTDVSEAGFPVLGQHRHKRAAKV